MRSRLFAITLSALLALGVAAGPAWAAAPGATPTTTAGAVRTLGPASGGNQADGNHAGMPVRPLADPGPECTGQGGGCWEYYSWYWTYSSCHDEGRTQLNNNPGRYDNYNCAGGHGLVVWLWLHRP